MKTIDPNKIPFTIETLNQAAEDLERLAREAPSLMDVTPEAVGSIEDFLKLLDAKLESEYEKAREAFNFPEDK